jgi:hypothetical protein
METHYIEYKSKKYEVKEPDIETWSKLILLQEWTDEREFSIKLLSFITGLTEEEIEQADWQEVLSAAQVVSKYFMEEAVEFKKEFEHDGKKYKFIDLPNLTFGEFIDIDTFLTKTPLEKKKELHLLMALLYREVDDNGNYLPYNSKDVDDRATKFKKLPVKYINGASSFFLRIDKISRGNSKLSFWKKTKMRLKMIYLLVKFLVLIGFGGGLVLLSRWLKKILPKWKK